MVRVFRDRLPPRSVIGGAVELLRETWLLDGAEGESVHLVCDALEAAWRELDDVSAQLPDEGRTLAERAIKLGERVEVAENATEKLQEDLDAYRDSDDPTSWKMKALMLEDQTETWMNRAQRAEHERDQALRKLASIANAALDTISKFGIEK